MPSYKRQRDEEVLLAEVGVTLEIDADGRIWKIGRWGTGKYSGTRLCKVKRRRAEWKNKRGYLQISLMRKGQQYKCLAHRLVYAWFSGELCRNRDVHHINGICDDNRLKNLEVLTRERHLQRAIGKMTPESVRDARQKHALGLLDHKAIMRKYGIGMAVANNMLRGNSYKNAGGPLRIKDERGKKGKLTSVQREEVKRLYNIGCFSYEIIGRHYGVSRQAIHQIVKHC